MRRPLSPNERFQYAEQTGGGLYNMLQLYQMMKSSPVGMDESKILKVRVPKDRLMKEGNERGGKPLVHALNDKGSNFASNVDNVVGPHLSPFALNAMGFFNGFNDEKSTYDDMEKGHLQGELDNAEKAYLHALSRIKTSAETPLVDAFVHGLLKTATSPIEEIQKTAYEDDAADGSMKQLFKDMASPLARPFQPAINFGKRTHEGLLGSSALAAFLIKQKLFGAPKEPENPTKVEVIPT